MSTSGKYASARDPYSVLAHFYDAEHNNITDDILLYRDLSDRAGPYVLDLACGTGRVGLSLAAEGKYVIAVDSSDTMLTIANGKLRRNRVPLELRRLDMRELDFNRQFDLVVCALDSFGHLLTVEDQLACLQGVKKALKPGGLFAVDMLNPNPESLALRDGALLLQSEFDGPQSQPTKHFAAWTVDYEEQIIRVDHMYDSVAPDGSIRRRQAGYEIRYVYRLEFELLLRDSGLLVQSIYSDYARNEYSFHGERMLFVASREQE